MALIQTSLIWVAYAVAIALLLIISAVFVYLYQTPRDRATSVTVVCTFTMLSLLATVLLLPVDVALVSSTTRSSEGRKKDWATPEKVDSILYTLKIVYYTLFSLDAVLCLLVAPFTYFFFEEYDEVATEDGSQTLVSRFFGAMKYTIVFVLLCVILFLVGFFVPIAKIGEGQKHMDLDYFKKLLSENRKFYSRPICKVFVRNARHLGPDSQYKKTESTRNSMARSGMFLGTVEMSKIGSVTEDVSLLQQHVTSPLATHTNSVQMAKEP